MSGVAHGQPLRALVLGRLSRQESERVLTHVSGCDRCLEELEQLWADHGPPRGGAPAPPPPHAAIVERAIRRRIGRGRLMREAVGLGTRGFREVVVALLAPLLHRAAPDRPEKRRGTWR